MTPRHARTLLMPHALRTTAPLALLGLLAGPPPARAETRELTLSQAVALAVRQNALAHQAEARLDEAEARVKAARGRLGPALSTDMSISVWNEAQETAFSVPGVPPNMIPPMRIRDQVTGQINLTLVQPLTAIAQAYKGYRMARHGQSATAIGKEQVRQTLAFEASRAYIGLRQGQTGLAIARSAVTQLRAQVRQVEALHRAGVVDKNDVLKVKVGLARAEEGAIRAEAGVAVAQSAVAVLLGLHPEIEVKPIEVFPDPPPLLGLDFASCVKAASRNRPELRIARESLEIARAGKQIAVWNLLPQLLAIANYQHTEGQGLFFPKNSFFVGGSLKWTFWEWGSTYYGIPEAQAKIRVAEQELPVLQARLYLELKQAFLELQVAEKALKVAAESVLQAEEAYRIEQAKYNRQAVTTTELLDAQLSVTRAQLTRANALYGWYLARAALRKAMGEPIP